MRNKYSTPEFTPLEIWLGLPQIFRSRFYFFWNMIWFSFHLFELLAYLVVHEFSHEANSPSFDIEIQILISNWFFWLIFSEMSNGESVDPRLKARTCRRGMKNGIWKLRNSIFSDVEFVGIIKSWLEKLGASQVTHAIKAYW